jgi:ABC-type branched-subunit amino acid transport system ATPase component
LGLVKAFGADQAVDGADLQVETGSVYGAIGPNGSSGSSGSNGAGKTTLPNVDTAKGRRTPLPVFSALDAMRS